MPTPVSETASVASPPAASYLHRDATASRRIARGVAEEVRDELAHAVAVGVDPDRCVREADDQLVAGLLDVGRRGIDGVLHDPAEVAHRSPQLNLVAGHPGRVEQVVDEPDQLLELAARDVDGLRVGLRAVLDQIEGEADGRQGIAQLVRERGEKLALVLIDLAERRLDAERLEHARALVGQPLGEAELLFGPVVRRGRRRR
jgi:hypothetical protein